MDFKSKALVKLDVHHRCHYNKFGKKMVTIEGIHVCPKAWHNNIGVPKTSFYWNVKKASNGVCNGEH